MGWNNRNSRRGFFFTAMALALLSFMLLSAQVWVRTFEQKDDDATTRFKGEAMRLVLSTLSDESMSHFANASAFYATYKLVNATEIEGLAAAQAADPANPGTGKVEQTIKDLMMNGSSPSLTIMQLAYSPGENSSYTILAWQDKIQEAANVMGFNASFGGVQNFTVVQPDPWDVAVYFEMQMNISDLQGTMHQSKMLKANATFPINGFEDPMITRDQRVNWPNKGAPVKQVWKEGYNTPADVAPRLLTDSASEGYGWFFGPLTWDYPGAGVFALGSGLDPTQYILVHGYDANLSSYAASYGAVIVTDSPTENVTNYIDAGGCNVTEYKQETCLNCLRRVDVNNKSVAACSSSAVPEYIYANKVSVPVIQAGSSWSAPTVTRAGMPDPSQQFVLIDNEYSAPEDKRKTGYHRIWDITSLRDMMICGIYVHSEVAPSFFQRMVAGAETLKSPDLGIESFVVGKWAGGMDDKDNDPLSRIDWEFYTGQSGIKIKGMAGCKNSAMCTSQDATNEGIGQFKMTQDALGRYSAAQIACQNNRDDTGSPC